MLRKESLEDEDTHDVTPLDHEKSWDINRKVKRASSRKYKSATVRFMGKRGNVFFLIERFLSRQSHTGKHTTGSGQDVIFANITKQNHILNRLESIIAADASSSSDEEEENYSPIPKHETGKTDLQLKQITTYINFENEDYRIVLCPQAPLVGNLRRKASFFPRLSKSHLNNTEIACIVYSLDDSKSFSVAEDLLMQMEDLKICPTTLLVANAARSLLKHRVVTAERGMKCAEKYGCIGFFEFNPMEISEADRVMKVIIESVHEYHSKIKESSNSETQEGKKDENNTAVERSDDRSAVEAPDIAESVSKSDRHRNKENGGGTCCVLS